MTTPYFMGTEDVSFILTGGISGQTSNFRSAFSRAAVGINSNSSFPTTVWPMGASAATGILPGLPSSFWVHGQFSNYLDHNSNQTVANAILLAVADVGGTSRILVRGTGNTGQLKISTTNAAGAFVDLATTAAGAYPAQSLPMSIDLFVNYASAGQCTLYINSVIVADTGPGVNITTNGVTSLAQAFFGNLTNYETGFNIVQIWSECVVQDTSTLGCGLVTLPPVAAGDTQSWTPNTVADVNPTIINDANFVSTTTASAISEWTLSTALPTGQWTINAVGQAARVSAGTAGPGHFAFVVRTVDGTDHASASVAPLIGAFGNNNYIWTTNPHTGVAWNSGELINSGIQSLT